LNISIGVANVTFVIMYSDNVFQHPNAVIYKNIQTA